MKHFIIPDTQHRQGCKTNHLEAAGNYCADKMPEVIVHVGDHWDMKSLSSYDSGKKAAEGTRYEDDIIAGIEGMQAFDEPIHRLNRTRKRRKLKLYTPRRVFLLGNHENRIARYVNDYPALEGKLSFEDLQLEQMGWECHGFLDIVVIDGIHYSHYFYIPDSGRPYGGMIEGRLRTLGFSFTMGHQQGMKFGVRFLNNGKEQRGLVVGSFYQHMEKYRGPQAEKHWNGCIMKNEVRDGTYCITELSLTYLLENWV